MTLLHQLSFESGVPNIAWIYDAPPDGEDNYAVDCLELARKEGAAWREANLRRRRVPGLDHRQVDRGRALVAALVTGRHHRRGRDLDDHRRFAPRSPFFQTPRESA